MPQWVELPPSLVTSTATNGKSIYQTDYSSRRPGFQIHLQKASRGSKSFHHAKLPKVSKQCLFGVTLSHLEVLHIIIMPRIPRHFITG